MKVIIISMFFLLQLNLIVNAASGLSKEPIEKVKDFDIKGIKLGMTSSQLKKIIKWCRNTPELKEVQIGKTISNFEMWCMTGNDSYLYLFDENKKLYLIKRDLSYKTEKIPNWKLINKKIIKKYGEPLVNGSYVGLVGEKKENHFSHCWGACVVKTANNGSYVGNKIQGINFKVEYGRKEIYFYVGSKKIVEHPYYITMSLTNLNTFYRLLKIQSPGEYKKRGFVDLYDIDL